MSSKNIALITGGAQGIGFACAEALAADGAQIVIADVNGEGAEAAAAKLGGKGYACDMADSKAVLALFDKIEAEVGTVSILVNNAGIAAPGDFPGATARAVHRCDRRQPGRHVRRHPAGR